MSEEPWPSAEEMAKIHHCPVHPNVVIGRRFLSYFGHYSYQYYCPKCIRAIIEAIPDEANAHPDWFSNQKIDPLTVQIVLDVLDQKLGI